jgi:hypothetical protein
MGTFAGRVYSTPGGVAGSLCAEVGYAGVRPRL